MARLQLTFSGLAGAALVGYLAAGGLNGTFVLVAAATLLMFVAVGTGVGRWLRARAPRTGTVSGEEAALRALDGAEVRRRALELLADPEKVRTAAGPAPLPAGLGLPAGVRDLFSRFTSVRMEYGDLVLDGSGIARSTTHKGFIVIGSDTEHAEVLVRPDDETVFIADPDERDVATFENYPSVYHLIVCYAAIIS